MFQRRILSIAAFCILSGLGETVLSADSKSSTTTSAPNILVLLADDLGWGDIRLHGGVARTPNIDRLAQEGVELRRYYAYPLCSPTRAALLTGQMPRRFGIIYALGPREAGLPAGLPTLPRTLQVAGYQTMLVGKWHLGVASPPLNSGFDYFYGFLGPEINYFDHTNRNGQVDWQRNGETVHEPGYSTFLLADEARYLIEERDFRKPFYLQVAFNAPHFPLGAPAEFEAKYRGLRPNDMTRAAMIDALDNAIGRILETLDEQGLRRNTLVLFLSDNGADQSGRNTPFRSGKGSTYEGGIRVPCILRWSGEIKPGQVSDQPLTAQDIYPTLAAAAGFPITAEQKLDGKNLWKAIQTGTPVDRGPFLISAANSALYDGDWKLIETADGKTLLFQIATDPGETTDLSTEQPAVTQRLQTKLLELKKEFPPIRERSRPGRRGGTQ